MPRGGAANRGQRGVVLWSLLLTPACGLIVGFEPRDLEQSSESSTSLGSGGSSDRPTGVGGTSDSGPSSASAEATTDGDAETTTGSTGNSDSGGAGEANTNLTETASSSAGDGGTAAGSGGTGDGGTGDGGTDAVSSSNGGSTADGSSNGGSSTTSDTAGGNGGSTTDGVGGAGTGGSGGDTVSSTTSGGGSGNAGGTGGSGGTGGTPLCDLEDTFDVSENAGVSSALMLGLNSAAARPWDITWVENNEVYVAARDDDETPVLDATRLDTGGTHNTSVIATQGTYAYVAYGELASGDATIVMNRLSPLAFGDVPRGAAPLGGDTAPRVLGIAMQGTTNSALVVAIDAEDAGILTLFDDTDAGLSEVVPGPIAALATFDLGGYYGLAYIQGGSLMLSLAEYDLSGIEMLDAVSGAAPIVSSPHSLSGAVMKGEGAALVWEQENGIYLTTLDSDGEAEIPLRVSFGQNDILPRVDVIGEQLFVSWIDANAHRLYLRRFPTGLTGDGEAPLMVADLVAENSYGLAADRFSVDKTLALVYATERLKLSIISCP